MGLAQLPTELLWLILERSCSPADLHSTFCASPFLLRAYLTARERIIASVLAGVILPEAQRHAIATAEGPVAPREEQHEELWEFLDAYFEGEKCNSPTVFPGGRMTLMNLMWLHAQVQELVVDYYEDAKKQFFKFTGQQAGSKSLNAAPEFAILSRTEIARLQRAFYRYEVYSRCFGVSAREKWVSRTPVEAHHEHFLGRLEPWQVEELCCVHQFLMARIAPVVENMQDEIVATVLSHQLQPKVYTGDVLAPSGSSLAPNNSSISPPHQGPVQEQESASGTSKENRIDDDDICEYEGSGESQLRIFSSRERIWFYHWVSDVTSFGLMYVKGFLDSSPDAQRDVFLRNASKHRNFLPHVLINVDFDERRGIVQAEDENVPVTPLELDANGGNEERSQSEDLSLQNLGYQMFKDGPGYPTIPFLDNKYWPLRRLGYVFWDSSRILEPNFQDCLINARDSNDREFDSTKNPSAEELLKGVKLPRHVMNDIQKRYGIWPWERE